MDIQTGLLCVGFVVLSGAVLLVVSMFGIKEKTYEEALAEQRKMPDGALLIRRPAKNKTKDKKSQRTGKKVKEKKKEVLKRHSSTESDELAMSEQEPVHVKIMPEAEVLGKNVKPEKKKKNKVKPILVHRDPEVNELRDTTLAPPVDANHFEEIQPKDDLALRRSSLSQRGDYRTNEAPVEESNAEPQPKHVGVKDVEKIKKAAKVTKVEKTEKVELIKTEKTRPEAVKIEEPAPSVSSTPIDSSPVPQTKNKDRKKTSKKQDNNMLLNPVTLQQLSSLILKAELSPNERQILTDLLLNDHQDERIDHSEWSEGMQISKLKKQLAEKDEALANEVASSQAFQNKLKELRSELNEEKTKCRHYEEGMMSKHTELQTLQARMMQQNRERQALVQEVQQLQVKVKDDCRTLQESGQAQVALQQEIHTLRQQIQQMEVHLARLSESENTLKAQLHAACSGEMQKSRLLEDELRDTLSKLEALKDSNNSRQQLATQLEEVDMAKRELEQLLKDTKDELEFEKKRLTAEVLELTGKLADVRKEVQYEKSRLQAEIHTLTNKVSELQVDADKHKLASEKSQQEAERLKADRDEKVVVVNRLMEESKNLLNERERLVADLSAIGNKRTEGDGRENGGRDINTDFINHENESKKKDFEKLRQEFMEKVKELEKMDQKLKKTEQQLEKTEHKLGEISESYEASELQLKTEIMKLKEEYATQQAKNNDLRQKNWKAVDALGATEKALETKVKETEKLINAKIEEARSELKQEFVALLKRLLPEVNVEKKNIKEWISSYEAAASAILATLRSVSTPSSPVADVRVAELEKQVQQLQSMAAHYKTIIDETEGMLNKLQNHIEAEELRWSQLLEARQTEIDSLKSEQASLNSQIQEKTKALEELKLQAEKAGADADRLRAVCNERDVLQAKLTGEQERLKELNKELVKLRSNLKIGQDSYEAEHKIRLELEDQLKAITCRGGVTGDGVANMEAPLENGAEGK